MTRALTLALLLLLVSEAKAQPVISSDCTVSFTEAWVTGELPFHRWRLSSYTVEFAPTRTGPWTLVTFALAPTPTPGLYAVQCPGYVPSGAYWVSLRPVSVGGWHVGGRTHPAQVTLERAP